MANFNQRLPYVSGEMLDSQFAISTNNWRKLEKIYRTSFSDDSKTDLIRICQYFLNDADAEKRAASESAVSNKAKEVLENIDPFIQWGFDRPECGDAETEFESRLASFLGHKPIVLAHCDLRFSADMPAEVNKWLTENSVMLVLSKRVILNSAINLSAALDVISQGKTAIDSQANETGFKVGSAWKRFLAGCKQWAKTNGLSHSSYKADRNPGLLPAMIFELHRMFPEEMRHKTVRSAEALAKQMQRLPKP
jgi:hypothetical protein